MPENLVNALKGMKSKAVKKHVRIVKDRVFLREDHFDFYEFLYKTELNYLNYKVNSSWDKVLAMRGEVHYLLEQKLFWTGYVLRGEYNTGNLPRSDGIVLSARDRLFAGDVLFDGHKNMRVLGDLETTAVLDVDGEYTLPKTTFEVFLKIFRNKKGYENITKREGLRDLYRLFADSEVVQTKDGFTLRNTIDGRIKWDFITRGDEIVSVSKEGQRINERKNVRAS